MSNLQSTVFEMMLERETTKKLVKSLEINGVDLAFHVTQEFTEASQELEFILEKYHFRFQRIGQMCQALGRLKGDSKPKSESDAPAESQT